MIHFFFNKSMFSSYLLSVLMVIASVYFHFRNETIIQGLFFNEKNATALLLIICLLTVDWSVKKYYWADKSSYHLLVFSLGIFALPVQGVDNWMLFYAFFFWTAFIHLLAISSQGQETKSTFNASFFLCFGSLFFPEGILLFPFIWLVLLIHGLLNARLFLISLLPFVSLYLLGVIFDILFPSISFFQEISFNRIAIDWSSFGSFRQNIWWLLLLGVFIVSLMKHYVTLGAKSANFGAGIFSLSLLGFLSIVLALLFQSVSVVVWVLFIMTLSSVSGRFFEEIKHTWLREGLFFFITVLLFVGKTGILF